MTDLWKITENSFEPKRLRHFETAFTQGNGYLGTRATFDETYPGNSAPPLCMGFLMMSRSSSRIS